MHPIDLIVASYLHSIPFSLLGAWIFWKFPHCPALSAPNIGYKTNKDWLLLKIISINSIRTLTHQNGRFTTRSRLQRNHPQSPRQAKELGRKAPWNHTRVCHCLHRFCSRCRPYGSEETSSPKSREGVKLEHCGSLSIGERKCCWLEILMEELDIDGRRIRALK